VLLWIEDCNFSCSVPVSGVAYFCGVELARFWRAVKVGSVERGERNIAIDNMEALARGVKEDLPTLLTR